MVVHTNNTARPIGEVKLVQAQSVVRSVRTCEAWVMTVLSFSIHASPLFVNKLQFNQVALAFFSHRIQFIMHSICFRYSKTTSTTQTNFRVLIVQLTFYCYNFYHSIIYSWPYLLPTYLLPALESLPPNSKASR